MVDPLLLTTTRITTHLGSDVLTSATGCFYESAGGLFLVTSRHVLIDEKSDHYPDRIEIELHTDKDNLAQYTGFSIPLYSDGMSLWKQAEDAGGEVDIAAILLNQTALPEAVCLQAYSDRNLLGQSDTVEIGSSMLVVGFPLGFHDSLHHLPVVRHAINASPVSLRFQGQGYFLTDSRTHRGTSGAPVVMRAERHEGDSLPWRLMGIHSSRMDVGSREDGIDEALGLNCVWFADILPTLTGSA